MKYTPSQYGQALAELLADAPRHRAAAIIRNALAILRKNKDMRFLGRIVRAAERAWLQRHGMRKIAVASASGVPQTVKKEIEAALGAKTLWEETVDSRILGGIRIVVDDELLIDASAQRRLGRMFGSRV